LNTNLDFVKLLLYKWLIFKQVLMCFRFLNHSNVIHLGTCFYGSLTIGYVVVAFPVG
jgi:hypothetical protein